MRGGPASCHLPPEPAFHPPITSIQTITITIHHPQDIVAATTSPYYYILHTTYSIPRLNPIITRVKLATKATACAPREISAMTLFAFK